RRSRTGARHVAVAGPDRDSAVLRPERFEGLVGGARALGRFVGPLLDGGEPAAVAPAEGGEELRPVLARDFALVHARSSRTSESEVCEKSAYHSPTAEKSSGERAHTTSSASRRIAAQVSRAPVGTATTTRAGPSSRTACTAAFMVEPVARPSSTRITVLPATSSGPRAPRYACSRRSSSASSSRAVSSIACGGMWYQSTMLRLS